MLEIKRYAEDDAHVWNDFVAKSKNGTFLIDRRYMDYHKERFTDSSLMVYDNDEPTALLPANIKGDTLFSHGGLTYGGLIVDSKMTAEKCTEVFQAINAYLKDRLYINKVVYKPTPWIYHTLPADEDLYAIIQICHATLANREISTTVSLGYKPKFSKLRHRGANKARRNGLEVKESSDLCAFWHILDNNLEGKYHVHPVHNLEELQQLKDKFPDRIRLFMAYLGEMPLGGTLVYDCGNVVHTQYISASPEGKATGALDLVFEHLITNVFADRKYLDFGKSTEDGGRYLNTNLIHQKEGFGGRGVCYDTYEWTL